MVWLGHARHTHTHTHTEGREEGRNFMIRGSVLIVWVGVLVELRPNREVSS